MIAFNCPGCGKSFSIKDKYAGTKTKCRGCGTLLTVPKAQPNSSGTTEGGPPATGIPQLLAGIVVAGAFLMLFSVLVIILLRWHLACILLLVVAWTVITASMALRVLIAKALVLRNKEKQESNLFFGLAKMVAWNPFEGVVLLRDKSISHVDDNPYDGGGLKLLYPIFGDELAIRIPLRQSLEFYDHEVLTREFIPLKIRGTIQWQIVDIERFYLHVSEEIHGLSDRRVHNDEKPLEWPKDKQPWDRPRLEVAKHLLTLMAEEQTRTAVAQTATGLLFADQFVAALPGSIKPELEHVEAVRKNELKPLTGTTIPVPSSSAQYRSATDNLAATIQQGISPNAQNYGILIHQVGFQEVNLPPEIYAAAREACAVAYLPIKAHAEATARKIHGLADAEVAALGRKMKLQAEADVIGADAVGMREVVGSVPPFALADFLTKWFADFAQQNNFGASRPR